MTSAGLRPRLIHAANSAATLRLPKSHFDMVRVGKALYGPLPGENDFYSYTPSQILSLRSRIVQIHDLDKGERVGYGGTYEVGKKSKIATIPVGYGDGFRRSPQNFGFVLVKGRKVPLVGRVSMDQASIDVSSVPDVKVGEEIVIVGSQGENTISLNEVAKHVGTIAYEVTTSLTARVVREYTGGEI